MDLVEVPGERLPRRHPWEVARRAFFLRVLRGAGLPRPGSRVLDVGAGDAWFASGVYGAFGNEVVCWDRAYRDGEPGRAVCGLSFVTSAPAEAFELVLALDVVEHVEDDGAFVSGVVGEHLARGGHLLFSVPAWPSLFSGHDARLRHVRRYTPRGARRLLQEVGLRIVRAGGLFHSLLLPRALQKLLERAGRPAGAHAGEWRGSRWVSTLAGAALRADTSASYGLSRLGWDVPGLSWWALCRRP